MSDEVRTGWVISQEFILILPCSVKALERNVSFCNLVCKMTLNYTDYTNSFFSLYLMDTPVVVHHHSMQAFQSLNHTPHSVMSRLPFVFIGEICDNSKARYFRNAVSSGWHVSYK